MPYQRANNCSSATNPSTDSGGIDGAGSGCTESTGVCATMVSPSVSAAAESAVDSAADPSGVCIDALLSSSADIRGGTLLSGFGANANMRKRVISKPLRGSGAMSKSRNPTKAIW